MYKYDGKAVADDGRALLAASLPECDNCAQALLSDLERLDGDLGRIKSQLENASASASSQDRLRKLEKAISDTKVAEVDPA